MPRVPLLSQVQSAALGAPRVGIDPSAAGGAAVVQGLQQLGAGVAQASGDLERVYRHEKQRAQAVAVTNAETEFSRRTGEALHGRELSEADAFGATRQTGFLELRGESAAAASAQTVEQLRQLHANVAERIPDAEARQLFLQRSAARLESAVGQVESHVGAEVRAAGAASLKATITESLRTVANARSLDDEGVAGVEMEQLEGNVRALALSPEAAEAQLADIRASMAAIRLRKRLDVDNDWQAAEALYAQVKDVLGPEASTFEKELSGKRTDAKAEALAGKLAGQYVTNGLLDEAAAMEALRKEAGGDVKLLDESTTRLRQRAAEARRAWDAHADDVSRRAFAAFNKKGWGGMPSKLRDELNEVNPNLWNRLRDESEQRYRRSQESKSDALRAQSEANRLAMQEYMKLPQEERAALDAGVFTAGMGVDKLGLGAIEVQQRRDKDAVQKGQSVREGDFVRTVRAEAAGVVTDKKQLELLEAEARIAHDRFVQDFKRPPNMDEERQLTQGLLQKVTLERWGFIPDGEQFEFQRRASERKDTLKKQPAGAPPAAPASPARPASAQPASPQQPARLPIRDRALQLKRQGKSKEEAARILTTEGYDLSELGN